MSGYVFGTDTWWLILLKALGVFVFLVLMTLWTIWLERRVLGRMQNRIGPNRTGPQGLLQALADGAKAFLKEDIMPRRVDRFVFLLAPFLSAFVAFMGYAVIPLGPTVSVFGHQTVLQLTDLPVGVLYIVAVASVGVYGIVLSGWSSQSTYSLLGGLRSSAQVISYEVAMGLSFVAVFLFAGSMSTSQIVTAQTPLWFALPLLPSMLIYGLSALGETNRAPFDLPEAEQELVGGYHTEYAGMQFAMFYLAEYINMITASSVLTTLFLGGWRAPWPLSLIGADAAHPLGLLNTGWWPILWFVIKVNLVLFVFIWMRATLPRLRYDQFMALGWKVLIPVSLVWTLAVAAIRVVTTQQTVDRGTLLTWIGIGLVVVLALTFLWDLLTGRRGEPEQEPGPPTVGEFDPMAGGYPVPPLPGQILPAYATASARRSVRTAQSPSAEPPTDEEGPRG